MDSTIFNSNNVGILLPTLGNNIDFFYFQNKNYSIITLFKIVSY